MALLQEKGAKRVLILEHDEDIAYQMETGLAQAGYEAEWIVRSPDVLSEVRRHGPDLLVLDLVPEADEYRLLDALRVDPSTRGIAVAVTTTSSAEVCAASFNVCVLFSKPFDANEFLTKVRQALGVASAAR